MKNVKVFATLILAVISIACTSDDDTPVIETTITVKDFETTIDENPTAGQELGTIDVTTNQGTLTYSFKSEEPSSAFAIDSKTGKLTVKEVFLFDYEARKTLTATVLIKNGELTKEAKVTIHINDVEDSNITVKDFETTIDENPTAGQELGTIEATTDQGELAYSLKNETPEGAFEIDTKTGKLTVKDATLFDYETRTSLTATIWVKNRNINKEAKIVVNLIDIISDIGLVDPNFKRALIEHINPIIDTNNDGEITIEEAMVVKTMDISDKNISNLSGIQHFTSLTTLRCTSNKLTTLDISNNTALNKLYCNSNQITELDTSNNTALTSLWCNNNKINTLNIKNNILLTDLSCGDNQLEVLDVTKNIDLNILFCSNNNLKTINVTNNTKLTRFSIQNNQISALNIENNLKLTDLRCFFNKLTELDLSKHNELTILRCEKNQLASLNLKNGNTKSIWFATLSNNPSLTCIEVDDPSASYLTNWQKDATANYSSDCTP